MKQYLLCFLLGFSLMVKAQNKIKFEYDLAGNQIQRLLCINCINPKMANKPLKEITALAEDDLQKFNSDETISYYPNPVKEKLYLRWNIIEENYVATIQIFDIQGSLLKKISNLNSLNNQNIAFQSYPSGTYAIVIAYKNGNHKTIKIIKK